MGKLRTKTKLLNPCCLIYAIKATFDCSPQQEAKMTVVGNHLIRQSDVCLAYVYRERDRTESNETTAIVWGWSKSFFVLFSADLTLTAVHEKLMQSFTKKNIWKSVNWAMFKRLVLYTGHASLGWVRAGAQIRVTGMLSDVAAHWALKLLGH